MLKHFKRTEINHTHILVPGGREGRPWMDEFLIGTIEEFNFKSDILSSRNVTRLLSSQQSSSGPLHVGPIELRNYSAKWHESGRPTSSRSSQISRDSLTEGTSSTRTSSKWSIKKWVEGIKSSSSIYFVVNPSPSAHLLLGCVNF